MGSWPCLHLQEVPRALQEPLQGWAGLHPPLLQPCHLSVQIDLPPTMKISRGLPGLYTAVQMHLHWGGLDLESSGSEHTIDGMRYFAEVGAARGCREGSGPPTLGNCIPQSLQGKGGTRALPKALWWVQWEG